MYTNTHTYTITMEVLDTNFNVKSRYAQVQSNTAQVNAILHVHNQLLYGYFNFKTKISVSNVQIFQKTKIHTFK